MSKISDSKSTDRAASGWTQVPVEAEPLFDKTAILLACSLFTSAVIAAIWFVHLGHGMFTLILVGIPLLMGSVGGFLFAKTQHQ